MQVKQVQQNEACTFIICKKCERPLQVVVGSLCHTQSLCHRCSETNDRELTKRFGRYGVA